MDNILINTLSQTCKKNPIFAIILGLFLYALLSTVLVQLLFFLVSTFTNFSYDQILEIINGQLNTPTKQSILRLIQGSSQILTWGLAAVLMAILVGKLETELRLYFSIPIIFYGLAAIAVVLIIPVIQWITLDESNFYLPPFLEEWEQWVRETESRNQELLSQLLYHKDLTTYLANILVFAIIPAFTEEFFFRGFLQKNLYKLGGVHVSIWTTALLFSLFHLQFYGFFSRLFLGAFLGYVTYGAGSITPAIFAHFLFNSFTLTAFFQAARQEIELSAAATVKPDIWVSLLALLGLVGVFVVYFRQANTHKSYDT